MIGYDVHMLTPAGVGVEHHTGVIETDGPWLFIRDPAAGSVTEAWPAHAVIRLRMCDGGVSCGGRVRPTDE